MFNTFTDFYFIIGKDTLTIIKIACCKSEKKMYSPGELINVNFNLVGDDFKLDIILKDNKIENIFETISCCTSKSSFYFEEIGYFLYVINKHIETKMQI